MQVKTHLEGNGIEIRDYTAVSEDVALLAADKLDALATVKGTVTVNGSSQAEDSRNDLIWADPGSCCYALYSKLNPDKVHSQQSPVALAKALKVVHIYSTNKSIFTVGLA